MSTYIISYFSELKHISKHNKHIETEHNLPSIAMSGHFGKNPQRLFTAC